MLRWYFLVSLSLLGTISSYAYPGFLPALVVGGVIFLAALARRSPGLGILSAWVLALPLFVFLAGRALSGDAVSRFAKLRCAEIQRTRENGAAISCRKGFLSSEHALLSAQWPISCFGAQASTVTDWDEQTTPARSRACILDEFDLSAQDAAAIGLDLAVRCDRGDEKACTLACCGEDGAAAQPILSESGDTTQCRQLSNRFPRLLADTTWPREFAPIPRALRDGLPPLLLQPLIERYKGYGASLPKEMYCRGDSARTTCVLTPAGVCVAQKIVLGIVVIQGPVADPSAVQLYSGMPAQGWHLDTVLRDGTACRDDSTALTLRQDDSSILSNCQAETRRLQASGALPVCSAVLPPYEEGSSEPGRTFASAKLDDSAPAMGLADAVVLVLQGRLYNGCLQGGLAAIRANGENGCIAAFRTAIPQSADCGGVLPSVPDCGCEAKDYIHELLAAGLVREESCAGIGQFLLVRHWLPDLTAFRCDGQYSHLDIKHPARNVNWQSSTLGLQNGSHRREIWADVLGTMALLDMDHGALDGEQSTIERQVKAGLLLAQVFVFQPLEMAHEAAQDLSSLATVSRSKNGVVLRVRTDLGRFARKRLVQTGRVGGLRVTYQRALLRMAQAAEKVKTKYPIDQLDDSTSLVGDAIEIRGSVEEIRTLFALAAYEAAVSRIAGFLKEAGLVDRDPILAKLVDDILDGEESATAEAFRKLTEKKTARDAAQRVLVPVQAIFDLASVAMQIRPIAALGRFMKIADASLIAGSLLLDGIEYIEENRALPLERASLAYTLSQWTGLAPRCDARHLQVLSALAGDTLMRTYFEVDLYRTLFNSLEAVGGHPVAKGWHKMVEVGRRPLLTKQAETCLFQ